jgi:diguanylate cyclase (GGDEF)-like protein
MSKSLQKDIFRVLLMTLTYYLTGQLSFTIFSQDNIITMTPFAPEGFALAGVLIYGVRILPGIFFGQLILALYNGLGVDTSLAISVVNTLEAFIAYRLFTWLKVDHTLSHNKDILLLLAIVLFVLQPFSALFGNMSLSYFQNGALDLSVENLFFWWLGNVMGQLLFAPMILILYHNKKTIHIPYLLGVFLFFIVLNYLLQITFGIENVSLLLMFTLPTTIYLSIFNLSYASVSSVILASFSLYFTHLNIGTFTKENNPIDNIIDLNFFMLSHILLVLIIGVLFREKEEAIQQLESMAHYDHLTGLPNRHLLHPEIHNAIYLSDQSKKISAICFIDLDGFKGVNDTLGHHIGDLVLKETVKRVEPFLKEEDTLLRLGGDEFLLILNLIDSKEALIQHLEAVRVAGATPMEIEGNPIQVSFSMGVALYPQEGKEIDALIEASDKAMYQAKAQGKNRFVFAS